jgi:hypothetical protein
MSACRNIDLECIWRDSRIQQVEKRKPSSRTVFKGGKHACKGKPNSRFFFKGRAREAQALASGAAGPSPRISTLKIKRSIAFLLFAPWAGQFSAGADEVENNDNDMLKPYSAIV